MSLDADLIPDDLLALATPVELEAYRAYLESLALEEAAADLATFETDWRAWLTGVFPAYVSDGFAPHHEAFWRWAWAIEDGADAPPLVAVWPRGGAKSTSAELACVAFGARERRRYGLYICATQDQADDHVGNVGGMLESAGIARLYPEMARKATGKFGNPKGWRRNRLWTASGFVLDALGLDTAARGVKLDDQRPDLFVLDDLDSELDTPATVERKITTLTRKLLPAGAGHAVTLAIQNLVHDDSIFARLVDGRAEFLSRRIVSGPVPAVRDLVTVRREGRTIIVGGEPTWAGQDLATCQRMIDEYGETSFRSECQHSTEPPAGGMFDHLDFDRIEVTRAQMPEIVRVVTWVDPAVTNTDDSDSQGIACFGHGTDDRAYLLYADERRDSPLGTICRAMRVALDNGGLVVGIETDQGGDTWASVFREAAELVATGGDGGVREPGARRLVMDWAKAGMTQVPKAARAQRVLLANGYERDRIRHVIGTAHVARRALRRFPKTKPLDLVDCMVWGFRDLYPDSGSIGDESYRDQRARR